ncbi:tRNA (guanosine(37)-N1)-methyltransferase TrmD, partial [Micromonospora zhanjiangensis]
MRVDVVSIFPEYLAPLDLSLIGRARATGVLDLAVHDLRAWTHDVHRTVDDTPYGGGPGMVMRPEPWGEALDALAPAGASPPPRL